MFINRITTRIIVSILPVVIIATLGLAVISFYASYTRINHETESKMQMVLDSVSAEIECNLKNNAAILQAMVNFAETAEDDDFIYGHFTQYMALLLPVNDRILGGGIWFEQKGDVNRYYAMNYRRHNDSFVLAPLYTKDELNYAVSKWYLAGKLSRGSVVWSDIFRNNVFKTSTVKAVQPFFDAAGRFEGVCTLDTDLSDVLNIVQGLRIGETGRALLLDRNGAYVTTGDVNHLPGMLMIDDPDPEQAAVGFEILSRPEGSAVCRVKGQNYLIYYRTLPSTGWKLALKISEKEMYAPANSLFIIMLIITVAALALMIMVTLLLAGYFHKIISKLDKFAMLAAAGHLDERIELKARDEFSVIADHLNAMIESMGIMSRAKDDFLSRMSHEIRTPMNAILGMAQIGKVSYDLEKRGDCLQKIEDNSHHLLGIINDILDFSKIEAGKLKLNTDLISLSQNMDFVISMLKSRADVKGVTLNLTMQNIAHNGMVTDQLRMNQVLINLVSNAIKFTDPGGRVDVAVEELFYVNGEGVYTFTVQDTGIGIDPAQVQKLFTPFTQANNKISKFYGGTGLGLVISKNIVEMMGGQIEVETCPGEGSIFTFTIHAKAFENVGGNIKTNAQSSKTPDFRGKRALIVDDIDINREIAMEMLAATKIDMETAENGQNALDKYMEAPMGYYDIILMDMQMPVMGGCAATRAIRNSKRPDAASVKIIAMTANVMQEDVREVIASGMNGHIGKPVQVEEIFRIMTEMLQE